MKITENQRQILNGPIAIREVCETIKNVKAGKAPGPNRLASSYYKYFEDEVLQPLQQVMLFYRMERFLMLERSESSINT